MLKDYCKINIALIAVLALVILFNQYQLVTANTLTTSNQATGSVVQEAINKIIPTGTPEIYGQELKVSFDDPTGSLNILANLEYTIKYKDLTEEAKLRYDEIGSTPYSACEFCCGIGSAGFASQHKSACGCAHNLAFSGLTKYLLKYHADDFTDAEILEQIQKWKALFFPKQTIALYLQEQAKAGNLEDTSVLNQLPGMVGGC